MSGRFSLRTYLLFCAGIMLAGALIELAMGRVPICKCGYIHFWVGAVNSAENSQQIADWYSFSHVIHGFLLYGLARLAGRGKWPIGLCFALAVGIETSWEVLENTPLIIDRYRAATTSLDYYGDSVLNSMSDITFCLIGFALAAWLPVWLTVALALAMEVGVACVIRDNLTLNVIMLLYPVQAIKRWQMGG